MAWTAKVAASPGQKVFIALISNSSSLRDGAAHTHTLLEPRKRERDIVCSWRNPYGRRVAVYITLRKKIGIIGISREVDLIKINGCGREATRAHAPLSYPKFLLVVYNWLSFEREKDQNNNPKKINNTISLLSLLAYEVYAHCFS